MSTATISPPRATFSKCKPKSVVVAPEPEFVIDLPKVFAIETLSNMEDDVSWHDIFYWLKIAEDLQDSMQDCNQGLVYSHEEVKAEFEARWRQK